MRVLVKESDSVLADLSFEEEQVVIGSDPSCSVHLPDYRISGRNDCRLLLPLQEAIEHQQLPKRRAEIAPSRHGVRG